MKNWIGSSSRHRRQGSGSGGTGDWQTSSATAATGSSACSSLSSCPTTPSPSTSSTIPLCHRPALPPLHQALRPAPSHRLPLQSSNNSKTRNSSVLCLFEVFLAVTNF
uniref:Uncharacterized protein n=1 Tax=Triticum urartu TaxID=4572 RepID=A0A8R7P1I9_TRIUA